MQIRPSFGAMMVVYFYLTAIASLTLGVRRRLSARPMPKWVFEAVSKRFDYRPTLLHGFIGATELARDAAFSRTIALLKERLVLGASRLNIDRQRGGNRRKPYDGNTHYGPSLALCAMMLLTEHECNFAA